MSCRARTTFVQRAVLLFSSSVLSIVSISGAFGAFGTFGCDCHDLRGGGGGGGGRKGGIGWDEQLISLPCSVLALSASPG